MTDKEREACRLAEIHYEVEEGITQIFRLAGDAAAEVLPEEPIKLLEVNQDTIPSGVMPLQFGPVPTHGIHHRSIIVEVTPGEFEQIRAGQLELPSGWSIGDLYPKPARNKGA